MALTLFMLEICQMVTKYQDYEDFNFFHNLLDFHTFLKWTCITSVIK